MPFACIYVPNFPVAAALRAEPELQARAVAILEGKPPLEKTIAVNPKAARMGIAPGMTKAQAELCSELALRPRSQLQESATHAALLDCAQSFSPCVEDTGCDTVLLDLAGMESLFGPLPEISRALYNRADALGLEANVAVASNPDAAVLAARGLCGAGSCGAGALARVGTVIIPPGEEAEHLGSLPVEVLFADQLEPINSEKIVRMETRKKQPTACSKPSTAGAYATCVGWPRCRKFRSANVWDSKACACSNWRGAPLRARWSRWKRLRYLKKQSSWSTPSSCSSLWPSC